MSLSANTCIIQRVMTEYRQINNDSHHLDCVIHMIGEYILNSVPQENIVYYKEMVDVFKQRLRPLFYTDVTLPHLLITMRLNHRPDAMACLGTMLRKHIQTLFNDSWTPYTSEHHLLIKNHILIALEMIIDGHLSKDKVPYPSCTTQPLSQLSQSSSRSSSSPSSSLSSSPRCLNYLDNDWNAEEWRDCYDNYLSLLLDDE